MIFFISILNQKVIIQKYFSIVIAFYSVIVKSAEEHPDDVDMVEEKESDDSDEENNFTEKIQDTNNTDLEEDIIYQLSKSEEKELKKFRKVDYSWIAAL